MSINNVNFHDIKFNRETTVDYAKGDPVINTIFAQFDKDHNGVFNDEEYANYEKYLDERNKRQEEIKNIKVKNSVVNHYERKILEVQQKLERLSLEMKDNNINNDDFDRLINFENAHPEVQRNGYLNKKEIPDGALEYDISAFEMGIIDKEKDAFTGECYKKGYITGLETLNETEKKEYLDLLDKASNSCKKIVEYRDKSNKLEKELDKYFSLKDMAQNGILNAVGTEVAENQAYEQFVQIRNDANPFYKQIRELEAKYNKLYLKATKTDEDNRLLEQYRIQINQLESASANWSLSDMNEKAQIQAGQGEGFNIQNLSNKTVYSSQNETVSNISSLGLNYSNANWNSTLTFGNTNRYKHDNKPQHAFNLNQEVKFSRQKLAFSESASLDIDSNSLNYTQTLGAQYAKYGLNVSETISQTSYETPDEQGNMQTQTSRSNTTNVGASVTTGNFTNTASVQFAPEGTSYSLGTSANYNLRANSLNFNFTPSMRATYNHGTETTTLNPSLNVNLMYNNNNFNANAFISENYSTTVKSGTHPNVNNNFSINTALSFNGFGTGLNFDDNDSPFDHTNTYGAKLSYEHNKVGRFEASYAYQTTHSKAEGTNTHDNRVLFTYSAPLETINSWFKKK